MYFNLFILILLNCIGHIPLFKRGFSQDFASYLNGAFFLKNGWKYSSDYFTRNLGKLGMYFIFNFFVGKNSSWKRVVLNLRLMTFTLNLITSFIIYYLVLKAAGETLALFSSSIYTFFSYNYFVKPWVIFPEKITSAIIMIAFVLSLNGFGENIVGFVAISLLFAFAVFVKMIALFEVIGILLILMRKNISVCLGIAVLTILLYFILVFIFYRFLVKMKSLNDLSKNTIMFFKSVNKLNQHFFGATINRLQKQFVLIFKNFSLLFIGLVIAIVYVGDLESFILKSVFILFISSLVGFLLQRSFYEEHFFELLPSLSIIAAIGCKKGFVFITDLIGDGGYNYFLLACYISIAIFSILNMIWCFLKIYKKSDNVYEQSLEDVAIYLNQRNNGNLKIILWGWINQLFFMTKTMCLTPNCYYSKHLLPFVEINFPSWEKKFYQNVIAEKPEYLISSEDTLNFDKLRNETGMTFNLEKKFGMLKVYKIDFDREFHLLELNLEKQTLFI